MQASAAADWRKPRTVRYHPVMHENHTIQYSAAGFSPVLAVKNLSFHIAERPLFTDWSATIPPGVTLICGGEGCGKSTLLRLLAGVQTAEAGTLTLGAISLQDQPQSYRQQVFWAEARNEAFDQMTPVEYFTSLPPQYPAFDQQRLERLIDGLSLGPHLKKQLFMLSTGSKRKVWLAAAFASGARVILLDEPFVALDSTSVRFVKQCLDEAAHLPERACVMANYEAPEDVPLAAVIDLGD